MDIETYAMLVQRWIFNYSRITRLFYCGKYRL